MQMELQGANSYAQITTKFRATQLFAAVPKGHRKLTDRFYRWVMSGRSAYRDGCVNMENYIHVHARCCIFPLL